MPQRARYVDPQVKVTVPVTREPSFGQRETTANHTPCQRVGPRQKHHEQKNEPLISKFHLAAISLCSLYFTKIQNTIPVLYHLKNGGSLRSATAISLVVRKMYLQLLQCRPDSVDLLR